MTRGRVLVVDGNADDLRRTERVRHEHARVVVPRDHVDLLATELGDDGLPQQREQAEVRGPCPERPLVGENEISSTERLNPERVHRRRRGAQRSGGDSPHQHEQDDHRADGARHPPATIDE